MAPSNGTALQSYSSRSMFLCHLAVAPSNGRRHHSVAPWTLGPSNGTQQWHPAMPLKKIEARTPIGYSSRQWGTNEYEKSLSKCESQVINDVACRELPHNQPLLLITPQHILCKATHLCPGKVRQQHLLAGLFIFPLCKNVFPLMTWFPQLFHLTPCRSYLAKSCCLILPELMVKLFFYQSCKAQLGER